jgi:hypothetical protein
MMTERIKQLRRKSLEAVNSINAERALLITEFYSKHLAFVTLYRYNGPSLCNIF